MNAEEKYKKSMKVVMCTAVTLLVWIIYVILDGKNIVIIGLLGFSSIVLLFMIMVNACKALAASYAEDIESMEKK